ARPPSWGARGVRGEPPHGVLHRSVHPTRSDAPRADAIRGCGSAGSAGVRNRVGGALGGIPVNVTFVDPIAATANLTRSAIFRPDVPAIGSDPRSLQEMKLVELATQFARRGYHATVLYGDMFLDGGERTTAEGVRTVPVNTVMRFPFHPGLLPMAPGLLGHPALLDADVIQVSEFHQPSTFLSCV